jgi:DNA polymerase-3 subunit epsilon
MIRNREIVLDTETTGLDPEKGHRIIEIACVELLNHLPTGRTYQQYINPNREVSPDAQRISGLTTEFVSRFPTFDQIVEEFLEFIGQSPLIIHNADFDIRFLNAELRRYGYPLIESGRALDTVKMARIKFPGSPASLDALCRRFSISLEQRSVHGALIDTQLLAQVYLELIGGRQMGLSFVQTVEEKETIQSVNRILREARVFPVTKEEEEAHHHFLSQLKNPLWDHFK